ncbi:uncharacterized protein BCR38DRAFT_481805 [Pseudomassariella vexata]|uniref:Uncharacterized protein n=1 Tax=Pseudomassariella vexata TaxID=1141098 RepID=A0A1Y2EAI6_9PEZI|nr:uncharacterized protein BCR38DRAFT_481805 [Pseudomassariella vexata]ORY68324.1 hypothetical protein BCR38DRAFT_481805 [Pseudomassariella vexata]
MGIFKKKRVVQLGTYLSAGSLRPPPMEQEPREDSNPPQVYKRHSQHKINGINKPNPTTAARIAMARQLNTEDSYGCPNKHYKSSSHITNGTQHQRQQQHCPREVPSTSNALYHIPDENVTWKPDPITTEPTSSGNLSTEGSDGTRAYTPRPIHPEEKTMPGSWKNLTDEVYEEVQGDENTNEEEVEGLHDYEDEDLYESFTFSKSHSKRPEYDFEWGYYSWDEERELWFLGSKFIFFSTTRQNEEVWCIVDPDKGITIAVEDRDTFLEALGPVSIDMMSILCALVRRDEFVRGIVERGEVSWGKQQKPAPKSKPSQPMRMAKEEHHKRDFEKSNIEEATQWYENYMQSTPQNVPEQPSRLEASKPSISPQVSPQTAPPASTRRPQTRQEPDQNKNHPSTTRLRPKSTWETNSPNIPRSSLISRQAPSAIARTAPPSHPQSLYKPTHNITQSTTSLRRNSTYNTTPRPGISRSSPTSELSGETMCSRLDITLPDGTHVVTDGISYYTYKDVEPVPTQRAPTEKVTKIERVSLGTRIGTFLQEKEIVGKYSKHRSYGV